MLMAGERVTGYHGGGSLKPWVLFGIVFSLVMASNLAAATPKFSEWSTPINIGPTINSAANDVGPAISRDGLSLYLGSNRAGGYGMADIWVSQRASADNPCGPAGNDVYVRTQQPDGSFGVAQLVDELSSAANEQRPVIRFDGLELFLWSDRPGSFGGTDLWVSTRERVSDPWGTPLNLGGTVNSIYDEAQPYIASDRSTLLFSSNRPDGAGGFDLYATN